VVEVTARTPQPRAAGLLLIQPEAVLRGSGGAGALTGLSQGTAILRHRVVRVGL
jgi:hypothetical protein